MVIGGGIVILVAVVSRRRRRRRCCVIGRLVVAVVRFAVGDEAAVDFDVNVLLCNMCHVCVFFFFFLLMIPFLYTKSFLQKNDGQSNRRSLLV